jgi:hypothetical protein
MIAGTIWLGEMPAPEAALQSKRVPGGNRTGACMVPNGPACSASGRASYVSASGGRNREWFPRDEREVRVSKWIRLKLTGETLVLAITIPRRIVRVRA